MNSAAFFIGFIGIPVMVDHTEADRALILGMAFKNHDSQENQHKDDRTG
jgi:hypothetical protein